MGGEPQGSARRPVSGARARPVRPPEDPERRPAAFPQLSIVTMSLASEEMANRLRFCQYSVGLETTVMW